MIAPFTHYLAWSLEPLFPRECLVCLRPLSGRSLCFRCTPQVIVPSDTAQHLCPCCFSYFPPGAQSRNERCEVCLLYPPMTDRMRFLWEYSGLARDLIRATKYRPSITLARMSGRWLAENLQALFSDCDWDLMIPIPSSHSTFNQRLFHPCVEMASVIRNVHPRLRVANLLTHDKRRKPQAQSTHDERLRRLKNLFSVRSAHRLKGARVLLVEDVITTGATISAAAYALRQHGVATVDVVALARTRVWTRFRRRLCDTFMR